MNTSKLHVWLCKSARAMLIISLYIVFICFSQGQTEYNDINSVKISGQNVSYSVDELAMDVSKIGSAVRKVTDALNKEDMKFVQIKHRLEAIEGSGCDLFWEFMCPQSVRACISYYLVCDGEVDCPNGEDESECASPLIAGSSWQAFFLFQYCKSSRNVKQMVMEVVNETTPYYFTTLRTFSVTYDLYYFEDAEAHVVTKEQLVTYYHSSKAVLLTLEVDDKWIIECNFETENSDYCYGYAFVGGSDEPCAGVLFIRTDLFI